MTLPLPQPEPKADFWSRLLCRVLGHSPEFISETQDWIHGGIVTWQCRHCRKVYETQAKI